MDEVLLLQGKVCMTALSDPRFCFNVVGVVTGRRAISTDGRGLPVAGSRCEREEVPARELAITSARHGLAIFWTQYSATCGLSGQHYYSNLLSLHNNHHLPYEWPSMVPSFSAIYIT